MPVRINTMPVPAKPKLHSSATRYVKGSQVKKPVQTKTEKKAIRQVFGQSKSGRVPSGEGVSGLIIKMLLENKWTNGEITKAIEHKHGAEIGEIWRNRIAIFRCDINSGRRKAQQVKALHVHLPLVRLQRVNGRLVPAIGRDRDIQSGAAAKVPVKKAVVVPPRKVPVKK